MSEITQSEFSQPPLSQNPAELTEEQKKKEKKKEKKAQKEKEKVLKDDRVYLAFERTLLAWVRTGTNLLTFGFAIIKLLEAEVSRPGEHPILQTISPKTVGMIMIFAGFFGMLMAVLNFSKHAKAMGRSSRETYANPAMLVSYVIMLLCFLILLAPAVQGLASLWRH